MQVEGYNIPEDFFYDTNNYWIKVNNDEAIIGISAYGQSTIGDVLYVDTIDKGNYIKKLEDAGSVEAGKWVGRIIVPISGTILEKNGAVIKEPGLLNSDPYGKGWILRLQINEKNELNELMDAKAYAKWVQEQVAKEQEDEMLI
ncbi:MAG: glycine cleavage system protein GcvH [Syntrophomonadaceae bacterium]|nr:glycine cleavage system protein GcvH [Syntrophomonadaceae bacterium]MDD4548312.1 glycine cleavage system protein GcvH [Syntrophomonadaceae bacterium]